jgi:hypothetical protein
VGEPVAGGADLDDLPGEGEPVDDGGAELRVGEGLGPGRELLVARNRVNRAFLPLGENLE